MQVQGERHFGKCKGPRYEKEGNFNKIVFAVHDATVYCIFARSTNMAIVCFFDGLTSAIYIVGNSPHRPTDTFGFEVFENKTVKGRVYIVKRRVYSQRKSLYSQRKSL